MLSSTRALHKPPAFAIAQKEANRAEDADSSWGSQPPRSFGGGWARTRTAAPSDLTPEEKALRDALQKQSVREVPAIETTSRQDGRNENTRDSNTRGYRIVSHATYPKDGRETTPVTRASPRSTQRSSWFPPILAEEENGGPPLAPLLSPAKSNISPRPRFGGWAKRETETDLTPAEKALRKGLQNEAAPKPQLPVHRLSHSPLTSSVPDYQSRPNHPMRPEPQTKNTRSEETTPQPPLQASNTQEQGTHERTTHSGLFENRQARDAQLDRHISQSRSKLVFRPGDWYCPSCEQHVFKRYAECPKCQTKKPLLPMWRCGQCGSRNKPHRRFCVFCQTSQSSATAQEQTENVKHWKLIRRLEPKSTPEPTLVTPQQELNATKESLVDTQANSRARMIEQEKIERMERTKGGEFIGLRGQYETASSKAMEPSYWSPEPTPFEVGAVKPTASDMPDNSATRSGLVDWRSHPIEYAEAKEVQAVAKESSVQHGADRPSEDRPRAIKLAGGWKKWEPASAEAAPALQEFSQRSASDQIGRKGLDVAPVEKERRTGRKLQEQGIARQLVYGTTMPYVRSTADRSRVRKGKKVTSVYDDADEEDEDRAARRMERKEQRKKAKVTKKSVTPPTPIYLPEFISVSNLAGVLRVRVEDFVSKMEDLGFDETNTDHILDAETAGLVAAEFNFEPIFEQAESLDILPRPPAEDKSVLPPRPPVVTIMGHVDHGKTTLLDYLRKSSVAASEHGGITQHIGAFSVPMSGGRLVTFLDTPGHEAFLSMRQRGANVTDIVILVVAADDSVKPQTIEAIRHAQKAKVPMIVAVNKIDKEDSNAERVKQDLARYGVEIEDYGGDTQVVCVSGKTGQGMEELEDAAVALADILDMRSETDGQAEGWVLEATTKKAGRVATVLVRRGTLRPGDIVVAGTSWARVRSLRNEAGTMLKSAGPGTPVEIDGWREQPSAGDEVLQAPDEQRAKAVISHRLEASERTQMATDMAAVNEARRLEQEKREESERAADLAEKDPDAAATTSAEAQSAPSTPSFQEVFFIIKADVSGSVEAVTDAVSALGNSEVRPHILRTGVGPITEFDIDHAAVAKGHIISFNTTVDGNIQRIAEAQKVKILDQSIIYRLVDDVRAALSERLPVVVTQKVLGEAEVAQVFEINLKGRTTLPVAGCRVRNGVVSRNGKVRVLRGKEVVYDGMLLSLLP